MGLFGDKTSVTMEAEPNRLAPGDEVRGRITVGEPDKKARDGRVCLLYVNTYEYESTDSDGDTTVSTAHEKVVMAQSPLFGTGTRRRDVRCRAARARARPSQRPGDRGVEARGDPRPQGQPRHPGDD